MAPTVIGSYPVEREIGRGGMGIVYLGRDRRLDRPVAIKMLPELFARDPERLARFEREARLLASLTHPNIAGIYGLEEADGRRFLALEYVEGETLAEHLRRGPLALDETLDVCRQVANALEAAHEAGIVHRDLKPGNVKLTPAGAVKVLDFGLAKGASSGADSSPDLSQSPTMAAGAATTGAGVVLGTAAYMSPEQARGKIVDRRTDIWSFGCLLYECLTGRQAFSGETVSDLIAVILQGQPDWSLLPANTPTKLRLLLGRCLEKDARRRLRDIGDARLELEELMGMHVSSGSSHALAAAAAEADARSAAAKRGPARLLAFGVPLLVLGALAGAYTWNVLGPGAREVTPLRFELQPPSHMDFAPDPNQQAISPDGKFVAIVMVDSINQRSLWVRPLGSFEARPLPGTKDAMLPFWSPDGSQIGFFTPDAMKRVGLDGGSVETICDASAGRGASWSPRGTIVFAPSSTGPLYMVRAAGGTPAPATVLDLKRGETAHRWPCFLPDGVHFSYAVLPGPRGAYDCYVGSTRSKSERTPLLSATGAPVYAPPGHLVFIRGEAMLAQRFDPGRRRVQGEPHPIGTPSGGTVFTAAPGVSVSRNGVLVWKSAGKPDMQLVWLDRGGHLIATLDVPHDRWTDVSLSPDDRLAIAEQLLPSGNRDLWVVNLSRQLATRLTFGKGANTIGTWSPDSREILFGSTRSGPRDIYRMPVDGSAPERLFYHSDVPFKDATSWSPDGKWVLLNQNAGPNNWDELKLPSSGGTPVPLLGAPYDESNGRISPDGKWVYYNSNEAGTQLPYVQAFPGGGRKQQVAKTGVIGAFWTRGGRELILQRPDGWVLSVPVTLGENLSFGAPQELFRVPLIEVHVVPTSDGQRFLCNMPTEDVRRGISVAVNWTAQPPK